MPLKLKILYLASLAAFLRSFGQVIYVPSQGAIRQDLATTAGMVGLTISIYSLVFAFSQILLGPLVDRFPGKRIMVFGMALFVGGSLLSYRAAQIELLLAMRALQGLGIAAAVTVGVAYISDFIPGPERGSAMGVFEIFNASGAAAGPVAGSLISSWLFWRADFLTLAVVGTGVGLFVLWQLPDQTVRSQSVGLGDMASILRTRQTLGAVLHGLVMFYAIFTIFTLLPIYLTDSLDASVGRVGLTTSLFPLGAIVGSWAGGRAADRFRLRPLYLSGTLGVLAAFVLLSLLTRQPLTPPFDRLLEVLVFSGGILVGFCLPMQLKVMVDHFPDLRGTAGALLIFMRFLGASLAPVAGGWLADISGVAAGFALTAILLGLVFLVVNATSAERGPEPAQDPIRSA
jgi:predicted MFS family arabinose efflux permease